MNGRGTPVAGKKEVATEMFKKAWKPIEKVIPTAKILPYISGHLDAMIKPLWIKVQNKPITKIQPIQPNSSPITAKIKSVCASGIQYNFCLELPKPTPQNPPDANAIKD